MTTPTPKKRAPRKPRATKNVDTKGESLQELPPQAEDAATLNQADQATSEEVNLENPERNNLSQETAAGTDDLNATEGEYGEQLQVLEGERDEFEEEPVELATEPEDSSDHEQIEGGEYSNEDLVTQDLAETETEKSTSEEHLSLESGEVESAPKSKAQKTRKPGMLARFWRWLKSLFTRKKKTEEIEAAPVQTFDELWARRTLKKLGELRAEKAQAQALAEKIQFELSILEQEQLRIESWLEGLKRSYYWKLEQRMDQNLSKAKSDIEEYEGLVRALELPEKGTLRSLREKFHKGLTANFITFALPVFLLYFIPWFSRVDLFRWLIDLLRSPLFILLVVTIGALVAGIAILFRRVLGAKKVSVRKTAKWTTFAMLIPGAIYGLYRIKEFLLVFVTPVVEQIRPTALWVILILFVFTTLALLIIYYQGWSVFRRTVTEEVSRLENVAAGYVKTRQELARLEFLYQQTIDWMKLIAHTLYRPWKIHPDWKSPNQAQAVSESFPMALRVAQAVENDASESAQLRRTIAHRLLVQGWRTSAFENSLSEIGKYLGYEPDKVNPELLDADLPHQPNNARKLVLEYFEHSAETAHAGTLDLSNAPAGEDSAKGKPLPSDVYLVEVARDKLKFLIEKTQGSALAQARPSVQQIVQNPLAELAESDTESESLELSQWDEFLSEGLGIEDPTQPPIGVLAFTDEGKKARSASGVSSKVLVPGRFSQNLPSPSAESVEVVAIEDQAQNPPAELMLRFDVVGPMPFSHVNLIQNATTVRRAEATPQEENDDL